MLESLVQLGHPIHSGHGLARGLIGWWLSLPGQARGLTFRDLSGLRRAHGTHSGGVTWSPATRPGGLGPAPTYVSASSQYTDLSALDTAIDGLTACTLALWVNRTAGTFAGFTRGSNAAKLRFGLMWFSNNTIYGLCDNGTVDGYTVTSANTSAGWRSLALVYDASEATAADRLKIYLDAVRLSASATGTIGSSIQSTTGLAVGRIPSGGSYGYQTGAADDVAVWNRALSATEIAAWYRSSLTGHRGLLRQTRLPVTGAAVTFNAGRVRRAYVIGGGVH